MIPPTIGRVVWFQPSKAADQPLRDQPYAALVTHVHSDRCINVGGFDANGTPFAACSVRLLQDDDVPSEGGYFAQWMPYQKGQAAKAEAAAQPMEPPPPADNAHVAPGCEQFKA
jgi:hypothetical protein